MVRIELAQIQRGVSQHAQRHPMLVYAVVQFHAFLFLRFCPLLLVDPELNITVLA